MWHVSATLSHEGAHLGSRGGKICFAAVTAVEMLLLLPLVVVVVVLPAWLNALVFLCCRSSDGAAAENSSPAGPAAQTAQQPWRQPVLQPAKCEFKVPIKAFVWLWFHVIIQLQLPVPDPAAPPPHFSASCLEHVLMLFICCFHVRMSAFTVNNWCGLSKLSKMHASSDSLEPFDQKKLCCDFWYYQHLLAFNTKSLWIKN